MSKLKNSEISQLIDLYYVKTNEAPNADGVIIRSFVCTGGDPDADSNTWCRAVRNLRPQDNNSNLTGHIPQSHHNYMEVLEASKKGNQPKNPYLISPKVMSVYSWLCLVVKCRVPFTACEDQVFREQSKYPPICYNTLVNYFDLVSQKVAEKVKEALPEKFGLVFDGWTGPASRHYVGVYAVYPDPNQNSKDDDKRPFYRLLAMQPLLNPISQNAREHVNLLESTLAWYGRSFVNVLFLVGDNANINPAIAKQISTPEHFVGFIGCASHRLNLAMQDLMAEEKIKIVLDKISAGVTKLTSSSILSAKLEQKTKLLPVKRNGTRWSSTFHMISRYIELSPFLNDASEPALKVVDLNAEESTILAQLQKTLAKYDKVTVQLQGDFNVAEVRGIFDQLIKRRPSMTQRLAPDSSLVDRNFVAFESGLVKLISLEEDKLSLDEKNKLTAFRLGGAILPEVELASSATDLSVSNLIMETFDINFF